MHIANIIYIMGWDIIHTVFLINKKEIKPGSITIRVTQLEKLFLKTMLSLSIDGCSQPKDVGQTTI